MVYNLCIGKRIDRGECLWNREARQGSVCATVFEESKEKGAYRVCVEKERVMLG